MFTQEEDVEAHALRKRGWSVSAIARHLGRDRKTIRGYLSGVRSPGERRRAGPDLFAPFEPYVRERLAEDPHVWATALFDELVGLGYGRSYQVLTREIRQRELRPRCEACAGVGGRATIEIPHPAGEEIHAFTSGRGVGRQVVSSMVSAVDSASRTDSTRSRSSPSSNRVRGLAPSGTSIRSIATAASSGWVMVFVSTSAPVRWGWVVTPSRPRSDRQKASHRKGNLPRPWRSSSRALQEGLLTTA